MTFHVQRNYKNGLFLMIFGNKQSLLRLYNSINSSDYTNPDDLNLYEAQFSWNPNMPLRGLFYFSHVYEGYVAEHELNIYSKSLIKLPAPKYIVFYNGTEMDVDSRILKLSDAFVCADEKEACLECTATMININYGYNRKLMDSCRELYEYSFLVEEIRKGLRSGLELPVAVDHAVEVCIREEILKFFLLRHRAEVKAMILEEFDLNKQLYLERKDGFSEGVELGEKQLSLLIQKLLADSRSDDLSRALSDSEYRNSLYKEYHIK